MTHIEQREIVIVGGGMVGSALALALSRRSIPCTVLERAEAPLDLLRGELIQPAGVDILQELGVRDQVAAACLETTGITMQLGAATCDIAYDLCPPPAGSSGTFRPRGLAGWRRPMYEALGRRLAAERSVEIVAPFVARSIERLPDRRLRITSRDGLSPTFEASMVVVADGQASRLARDLGFHASEESERTLVQGFVGRTTENLGTRVRMAIHPLGVAWLFPFPDGFYRSTVQVDVSRLPALRRGDPLACHLTVVREAFPDVWELIGGEHPDVRSPFHTHPGRTAIHAGIVEDGLALAGDAAGCLDPLTGTGLAQGLRDAMSLAGVIADGDWTARALRSYERDRLARLLPKREANEVLTYAFLERDEPFAAALLGRLAARWSDRDRVLPVIAMETAGYPLPMVPSFGLRAHFLGLL
jgi:2-polyprenyl-6-methoxyphenol hydroxylase-like FAD-dependent oxidoreductase